MEANQFLENILKKIQIKPDREKHIRNSVKKIFSKFHEILPSCYSYRYGGSFKRYTSIKNYFDVDVYFVGHFKQQNLLNNFNNNLKELERTYKPFKIARIPPYMHAIPAIFNNDVELDCLAAIKLKNGFYKIPEKQSSIIINPDFDEDKLKDLNRTNSGRATKLIRLLKKWNSINNKPFKSYQIEAMTLKIFEDKNINNLDKGLKTFFLFGIDFIKNGKQIYDDVDNHPILKGLNRKSVANLMDESLKLMQQNKWTKIYPTI